MKLIVAVIRPTTMERIVVALEDMGQGTGSWVRERGQTCDSAIFFDFVVLC